jgi:hypothetical protein
LVEPEATDVGPVSVTVGTLELPLWHEVQVEPFFPENPEIPLELAAAGTEPYMKMNMRSVIQTRLMTLVLKVLEVLEVLR